MTGRARTDRYVPSSEDVLLRSRKVEGQVRGLQAMVDRDERCTAVVDQIAGVRGALHAVAVGLVDAELRQCLDAGCDRDSGFEGELQDVMRSVERLVRS